MQPRRMRPWMNTLDTTQMGAPLDAQPPACSPDGCTPLMHTPRMNASPEDRRLTGGRCVAYWNAYVFCAKSLHAK